MNLKRCLLAGLAVFVVYFLAEFAVNGVLLAPIYKATASVWRGEEYMRKLMGFMTLGQLVFSFMFAFIYAKGHETGKGTVAQGLRFGFLSGLLLAPMTGLVWYVVLPIPEILAFGWFATGMIECLLIGAVAGAVYR